MRRYSLPHKSGYYLGNLIEAIPLLLAIGLTEKVAQDLCNGPFSDFTFRQGNSNIVVRDLSILKVVFY